MVVVLSLPFLGLGALVIKLNRWAENAENILHSVASEDDNM